MSKKSLPVRAPLSRGAPRRRTAAERIVGAVEAATAIRALTRLTGKQKRRKLPRPAILAAVGGGLAAIAAGAILARKRSSGGYEPPASVAPGGSGTSPNGDSPEGAGSGVDAVQVPVVAPGADPEGAKLDVDAPNEGATGDHPA
jgi:hypothetical protein